PYRACRAAREWADSLARPAHRSPARRDTRIPKRSRTRTRSRCARSIAALSCELLAAPSEGGLENSGLGRELALAARGLEGPAGRVRADLGHERLVQLVSAAHGLHVALQRNAEQREVADQVEDLVAGELVPEAQPFGIQHAGLVQHDRVRERAAARQADRAQLLCVLQEAERARRCDLAREDL